MQVGELFVKLSLDMNNFKTQLDSAGVSLKSASDKMKSIGQTMSLAVTTPILGAGAASFKMAADFNDALGATDQIFRDASGTMKEWAGGLETYYGIAEGKALEYSNMMGTMLMNIGGQTEAEAAKQSQTLVQLAGDLTAMFGGTTESAVQALTGALKGNNTMLDNYGISATEAQIQSKALELGLIAEGESMDAASKQAATLALIMEQTSAAQGQASREADGASGQMRKFGTEMQNLGKQIGEILLPMITPIIEKLNELAQKFQALDPETQKTIVAIAGIAAAIGPLLVILGTLGSAIAGISAAMPVMGAVIAAITGPIGLVVIAIAALIAIGVALWKNWDEIKAKAQEIWGNIKTKLSKDLDDVTTRFGKLKDDVVKKWNEMWENVKTSLKEAVQNIITAVTSFATALVSKWEEIKESIKQKWDTMWNNLVTAVLNGWNGILSALESLAVNMYNWFINLATKAISWGSDLVNGFTQGIKNKISDAVAAAREMGNKVKDTVTGFFQIHSPSRLMKGYGDNVATGFAEGIKENSYKAKKASEDMAQETISTLDKFGDAVISALKSRYDAEERINTDHLRRHTDAVRKASDERIKQYDRELEAKLRLVDDESNEDLRRLQSAIDSINDQTEQEERALEEQEWQHRFGQKQKELADAETAEERQKIQDELNKMLQDRERKHLLEQRSQQIDALRQEMERVREQANNKRKQLEEEYALKKQIEQQKLADIEDRITKEMETIRKHYESLKEKEALEAEARKMMLDGNNQDLIKLLESYNPLWQNAGQSFGESLLNGLNSMKQSIQDAVNDMLNMVGGASGSSGISGAIQNASSYVIQAGDTLSEIAKKFGTTVSDLAKTNNISNPNLIRTGETLRIPTNQGVNNTTYGNVTVQNMQVSQPSDIQDVAKELFRLQSRNGRGLGIA